MRHRQSNPHRWNQGCIVHSQTLPDSPPSAGFFICAMSTFCFFLPPSIGNHGLLICFLCATIGSVDSRLWLSANLPHTAGSRVGQATAKSRSRMDARRRAFPSTTRGRVRAAGHGSSRHPRAGLADAATPPGKKAYESGFSRGRFHRLFHRRKRWKLTPSDTSSFASWEEQDGRKRIALASDCRECVCAGD